MRNPTALASIGSGLSMSKEYRDVFEDLIEKVKVAVFGQRSTSTKMLVLALE